jgi:hypothetical protein
MVKKNDYVLNPKTQRSIKVGGGVWRSLVKEGIFEGTYEAPDKKILYDIEEVDDIDALRNEYDEKLTPDIHAVRGRGKYKNKLVVRKKRITAEQMSDYTKNTAIQAVKENMDELTGYSTDDLEAELERIINEEMLTGRTLKNHKKKTQKQNNKKARFVEEVQDEEEEEYEEEEEDENEEEDEEEEYESE